MPLRAVTPSGQPSGGPDAKRNFILQQGLSEPPQAVCGLQYSALLFQPRLIGLAIVAGAILQSPLVFFALGVVLWWSAASPSLNPFDALYNWILASSPRISLTPAPAPRRFCSVS